MKLFQNTGVYPAYLPRLRELCHGCKDFVGMRRSFLQDCFGVQHHLKPILEEAPDAFLSIGHDKVSQQRWAKEQGLKAGLPLADILLAQIEANRSEIFYNLDPMRYGGEFVRRLPGCVRVKLAWRAAPSPGIDLRGYNNILCNFPQILEGYRRQGLRASHFFPAHDATLEGHAANDDRPIDLLFVGTYSRHHMRRAALLESVASCHRRYNVQFALDVSRFTRLAESPMGVLLPLEKYRRPRAIRAIWRPPVFGMQLVKRLSQAKIVFNASIDMAGADRGNLRCWEAMGARAALLGETGHYPDGMAAGETFLSFSGPEDLVSRIEKALHDQHRTRAIAQRGFDMIRTRYSKDVQWRRFQEIVADV